jgi:hypothetical protein
LKDKFAWKWFDVRNELPASAAVSAIATTAAQMFVGSSQDEACL